MAFHQQIAQDLLLAFPTPIFRRQIDDSERVNAALKQRVLGRERDDPGVVRSNVAAWHSREDLFDWPGAEIAALKGWVAGGIRRLTEVCLGEPAQGLQFELDGGAWANVLRDRGYNRIHNHPGCSWSGVYYVSLGERDATVPGNGQIEFLDPRLGADAADLPGLPFGGKLAIDPRPGLLLIFPGWLYHYVNPFYGTGERITVAFNVRVRTVAAAAREAPSRAAGLG